jgi:hypothetical protein
MKNLAHSASFESLDKNAPSNAGTKQLDHYHNLSLRILHVAMRRFPALMPGLDKVVQEQTLMLEAVCRGDSQTAEHIASNHVLSFEKEVRKII